MPKKRGYSGRGKRMRGKYKRDITHGSARGDGVKKHSHRKGSKKHAH